MSEEWFITSEMWAWAHGERFDDEWVKRETAKFCDYWRAQPGQRGRKVDWVATWRNWLRRASEDSRAPARSASRNDRNAEAGERFLRRVR